MKIFLHQALWPLYVMVVAAFLKDDLGFWLTGLSTGYAFALIINRKI